VAIGTMVCGASAINALIREHLEVISKAAGAIVSGSETSDSALAVPDVLQTPLAELGLVTRGPFGSLLQQSMQALLWSVGLGMIGLLLFLFIPAWATLLRDLWDPGRLLDAWNFILVFWGLK